MHAQQNVSNSSGAIPNINTTRILERDANWRPKNDHTHSLIPLCTYLYAPWNAGVGRTKRSKVPLQTLSRRPEVRKGEGLATRDYCTCLFDALWQHINLAVAAFPVLISLFFLWFCLCPPLPQVSSLWGSHD